MSEPLQPNGNPVRVDGITLRTPGLTGTATSHPPASPATRAATLTTDALEEALASHNFQTTATLELTGTREVPAGAVQTRSTSFGEPAIEVSVPDPGESWGQVILYTDEAGVTTWNFARDAQNQIDVTRGQGTRTYVVSRRVATPSGQAATRGVIGALGKKVLKVVVFPMIDPVLGAVGDHFASRWEEKNRPYAVRQFTPDNFGAIDAPAVGPEQWQSIGGGRALLMVHGTFSRAAGAFCALPRDFVQTLSQRYGGRVFALDHPTLSQDPKQNIEWLLNQVPDGTALDLDIVCHSRGGLVSRMLSERLDRFALGNRLVKVGKIVFVASPNAGTILADPKHVGDFIDSYTNILNFFPDTMVLDTLQAILAVVKQVAVGALAGLDGLQSMVPGGEFLTNLNQERTAAAHYYALASNFEPADKGLFDYAKNLLFDKLFAQQNDLVVPTEGVWDKNGGSLFPIADRFVFESDDAVQHNGYFGNAVAREKMLGWLTG